MIKKIVVLLSFQFLFALSLFCQFSIIADTLFIPAEYGEVMQPHIIARSGSLIMNQADSLHLISHDNFQLIEGLAENMRSMDSLFIELQELYDKDNQANQDMIVRLNTLLEQSLLQNQLVQDVSESRLNQIIPGLNESQQSLKDAELELQMANEQLDEFRRTNRHKGVTYIAGGAVVGLILGLIIAN